MSEKTPVFNRSISIGNLIQILVMVIGLASAWFLMDGRSKSNTEHLVNLKRDFEIVEDRIRYLETEQAKADVRFDNILGLLNRIDTRLERIEANQ